MQDFTSKDREPAAAGDDDCAGPAARLLMVDDDTVHRMIVVNVAAKTGYAVDQAADVQAASACIRDNSYDCILLDLKLGTQSGVELLTQLHEQGCEAPIIIISSAVAAARAEVMRLARLYALNVSDMPKPINLPMLRARLTEIRTGATADA